MAKKWYVVYSHAQKESLAASEIYAQGFDVYHPVYKKIVRHARRVIEKKVSLFPRYLFVSLDIREDMWKCINSTRGVVKLIMLNHETPKAVQDTIIDQLKISEDDDGLVSLAALNLFLPGQVVRVVDGPFSGQYATYKGFSDKQRVEILLEFLGKNVSLEVSSHSLEKVM